MTGNWLALSVGWTRRGQEHTRLRAQLQMALQMQCDVLMFKRKSPSFMSVIHANIKSMASLENKKKYRIYLLW